jgi:hypothetical protein
MGVVVPLFAPKPEQGRLPGVEYEPAGPPPCVLAPAEVKGLLDLFEVVAAFVDNPQMFDPPARRQIKTGLREWTATLLGVEESS